MTRDTPEPFDVRVVRGAPQAIELAAATAVLRATLAELARDGERAIPTEQPSAWRRSQRVLRTRIEPGPGAWNAQFR